MARKHCLVPICTNTDETEPDKVFVMVPTKDNIRKRWYEAIFHSGIKIPKTKYVYVCEDHFDLANDAENFQEYKTVKIRLFMKKDVIPHKNLQETTEKASKQITSSTKKRRRENIEAFESRKKLKFDVAPSTSFDTPTKYPTDYIISSPSGSFEVNTIEKKNTERHIPGITKIKKGVEDSPSSISSGSSFVPLSTTSSDEIASDLMKDYMMKMNYKVTMYNIEHNSRLFLGLPQEEYFFIRLSEEKCQIRHENIMLSIKKIRCDNSYALLSILFGKSESMVGKIFLSTIPVLANQYQNLIYFPADIDTLLTMPSQFLPTYKNVRSIIDCLEIEIATPSNAKLQAISWSQYKKTNTIKYLISSTPHGFINYISYGFGGRTSDKEILERSEYLNVLPSNCTVLADRGFKNVEYLLHKKNCTLVRPPSVNTSEQMTKAQVIESRKIAACRIHIERVIRRVREFKMLEGHSTVNLNLVPWLDYILIIACAIINTQGSLIK